MNQAALFFVHLLRPPLCRESARYIFSGHLADSSRTTSSRRSSDWHHCNAFHFVYANVFYFGLSHAAFLTARYQFIYGLRRTTLNCTTAPVVLTIWIMPLCMTLNRGPRVSSNERTCISNVRSLSDGDCWFQRGKIVPCFFGSQTGILI